MKLLYDNLDVKNNEIVKTSNDLASLINMSAYIEEHLTQHITLENIASSGACCKSRCSSLLKKITPRNAHDLYGQAASAKKSYHIIGF